MALQENPSSQSRPAPRLTVLEGVGWMILGLLLGLIIGWVIWPVEWADAEPGDLRPDAKAYYVSATADAYVASGGQDPNTALLRMQSFDDPQAAVMEAIAYFRESNDPNRAIREVNLRSLASALNAQLYATAPQTPRSMGQEITWTNWTIGILTGILLVVGGVWAWRRWQAARAAAAATQHAAGSGLGSWVNPPQSPPTSQSTAPATPPATAAAAVQPAAASPGIGSAAGPSPAVTSGGWQPAAPPERSTAQTGRPPIKFETFDSLADAPDPDAGSRERATPTAGEDWDSATGEADVEDTGEIQRISPMRSVADSQTRESRSTRLADDDEDSFEGDIEDDFGDDIEDDFENYNGFVDYAAGLDEDEEDDEDDADDADDEWEEVDISPPVRRLSPLFDDEDADADTESDTEEADDGPNWLGNWQPRAPGERTEPGNGPSLESPVESGKSADNDQASEAPADDPEEEDESGILPTVEGVLNAWRRPKNENEAPPVRGGPELGTFTAEYNAGILAYEQSFTVTSNGKDDGTPLGACGMGVNEKLDKSASHTNRVHVLDVWLYDGEDVRSASQILVSPGVDVESLGQEAESAGTITGEPLEIAAGLTFRIPTRNLLLDCRVVNAEFLDTDSRPRPLRSVRVEMKVRSVK